MRADTPSSLLHLVREVVDALERVLAVHRLVLDSCKQRRSGDNEGAEGDRAQRVVRRWFDPEQRAIRIGTKPLFKL